jgi:hypothetical protein
LKGKHFKENLTTYTYLLLDTLDLKQKLFLITRDNASNNSTLYCYLYKKLQREFNNVERLTQTKELMKFHGEKSYIQCLAHVINLVCKAILKELKASSHKDAKRILDRIAAEKTNIVPATNTQTTIVKLRLLIMWILKST